jgi:hypothetical protein
VDDNGRIKAEMVTDPLGGFVEGAVQKVSNDPDAIESYESDAGGFGSDDDYGGVGGGYGKGGDYEIGKGGNYN